MSDKPPIGKNPFEAEIAANTSSISSTIVAVPPTPRDTNSPWFNLQANNATAGIDKIHQLKGWMEVRIAPEANINKTPRELLNGVEQSEIKTFGWPIGITLQSREEYRPRPTQEGIKAEVAIAKSQMTARSSYDYWALTREGDFYLLQSFFEDMREENVLYFNTRIVRVAETLLFAEKLYKNFQAPLNSNLKVRISHHGLKGRRLSTSSPNRLIFENRKTEVESADANLVVQVGAINDTIVDLVQHVCSPMFQLFDFAEFGPSIYDQIVRSFIAGSVT